jgi:hypothetical protein
VDYDIDIKVVRQVRSHPEFRFADSVRVKLVKVTVEPRNQSFSNEFVAVEIWPGLQRIEYRECNGLYFPPAAWPVGNWPTDTDFTQIEYEADLVSLATRLAVTEWQRRQEGGQ